MAALGIIGLILGIIAIPFLLWPLALIGLFLGIIGICVSFKKSTPGFIFGIISTVFCGIETFIMLIAWLSALAKAMS